MEIEEKGAISSGLRGRWGMMKFFLFFIFLEKFEIIDGKIG